jgi:hypothetical protein
MAYKAYITNTRLNPLTLYYRPKESHLLLQVQVAARALNQLIVFADEQAFEAFKEQNALFLDGKTIILNTKENAVKEKEAVKTNEANAQAESKKVKSVKDKQVKAIEDAITTDKTKLETTVEKA